MQFYIWILFNVLIIYKGHFLILYEVIEVLNFAEWKFAYEFPFIKSLKFTFNLMIWFNKTYRNTTDTKLLQNLLNYVSMQIFQ